MAIEESACKWGFSSGLVVNNLPVQEKLEMQVRSLGREDPLEEEMATCSSTLAWEIPWTEAPGGLQFMGLQRIGHDWAHTDEHTKCSINDSSHSCDYFPSHPSSYSTCSCLRHIHFTCWWEKSGAAKNKSLLVSIRWLAAKAATLSSFWRHWWQQWLLALPLNFPTFFGHISFLLTTSASVSFFHLRMLTH